MSKRDKKTLESPPPAAPFNNPFGALAGQRGELPAGVVSVGKVISEKKTSAPAKAVVRLERKGHGGKEVTSIEQLALGPVELELWCTTLKRALGCGGVLEDGVIIVQGDHRERVEAWLKTRGVKRVSVG